MTTSIHRLIGEALAARNRTAPATPCLDADTAAAFVEDTLPADERSCAEAHVTDCADCQALLAALARTIPATAPRAWWRRPAVAWVAPFAAAAAAAIVWINVSDWRTFEPAASVAREGTSASAVESTPSQSARNESALPLPHSADAARSGTPSAVGSDERRGQAKANDRTAASKQALADSRVDRPAGGQNASVAAEPSGFHERLTAVAPSTSSDAAAVAAPAAGGAQGPLPSTRAARTEAFQAPPPAAAEADSTTAAKAASPPPPSLSEAVTLRTETMRRQERRREAAREVTVVSPDPLARWRIGIDGSVQYSGDGGATWQAQSLDANVTPTAGSSPSRRVCWLVGRAGLVVITLDEGRSWQRLPFPANVDLTSIHATDDQTAIVVVSDGRTFRTSDRGRTWRR